MDLEQGVAKKPKRDLSGYAALIVAVTGLVTVFVHRPPEEAAKAGYIELAAAVIESQAASKQNHEDIVGLRAYLDNYMKGHEAVVTPVASTVVTLTTPPPPGRMRPAAPPAATSVVVQAVASAPPPPSIAPQAAPKRLKAADSINW